MFNSFEDPTDVPASEAYMEDRFIPNPSCGDFPECHSDEGCECQPIPVDDPEDEGYYYSGTGEWSEDDSYIDYLNR